MLKIHKHSSKKLLIIPIASICSIGVLLGLSVLTYTPELSHAETVVSPEPKPDLSTITYMQDITQEICTNTKETDANGNYQYQLIDKRDGKTYWVAKLKDGNCWMTQNLALDLSTSSPLTSELSDVTSNWTPTNNTQTTPSGWGTDSAAVKSYNPGEYVYTTPTVQNQCAGNSTGLSACTGNGWYDVTGKHASNVANFYQANGNSVVSADEYDAHYLAGNYYSWPAATAQSGASLSSGNATSSICPKGWQLPTSNNTNSKSFGGLFAAYGSLSGLTAGAQDIRLAPLYFVYGGYVVSSALYGAGNDGRYWPSTASYSTEAYVLGFTTSVDLSRDTLRFFGHSIRCMTPGGERLVVDNVEITIDPTITLDVANEVEVMKSDTNPSTANLDVKVTSNQRYSVQINAKDHAELTSSTTDIKIPSASGALNGNTNAWGIKKPGEESYTEVTTTPQLFYQSTVAEIKTIPFIIGISTAPDIPNGEYSTDITVTATQN